MSKKDYKPAYKYQRERIIKEHNNRCDDCNQLNGTENKFTGNTIKLQVCHKDQNPANHSKENVFVWCQWCHSTNDRDYKKALSKKLK